MDAAPKSAEDVWRAFAHMPRTQLVFFILAGITWLVGGNVLVALHRRRIGKRMSAGTSWFDRSFFAFNRAEWLAFAAIATLALLFLGIGVTLYSH